MPPFPQADREPMVTPVKQTPSSSVTSLRPRAHSCTLHVLDRLQVNLLMSQVARWKTLWVLDIDGRFQFQALPILSIRQAFWRKNINI